MPYFANFAQLNEPARQKQWRAADLLYARRAHRIVFAQIALGTEDNVPKEGRVRRRACLREDVFARAGS
jgi:hypothetical protein